MHGGNNHVNRQFQVKSPTSKNSTTSEILTPIKLKFEDLAETINYYSWVVYHYTIEQIQHNNNTGYDL